MEEALRRLVNERHAENEAYAPARALNLVAIVDGAWRGEVENRLSRVGRYHASRTVVCSVEPGRSTLSARAVLHADEDSPGVGELASMREMIVIDIGPEHLRKLDRIVDPLVVTDVATAVWAPHGHGEAVDALCQLAQAVLHDTADEADARTAFTRARELGARMYVVDLAWLRTTPWRERIAATFDPPRWRGQLAKLSAVTVRHSRDSAVPALLFAGWLSCRLGWTAAPLTRQQDALAGHVRSRRGEVTLRLEAVAQEVRGLSGVTVETADGLRLSLDRGRGGLAATRRLPDGRETSWTILGASRGEAGILGEGIRQALLRDPTYAPALGCAEGLIG